MHVPQPNFIAAPAVTGTKALPPPAPAPPWRPEAQPAPRPVALWPWIVGGAAALLVVVAVSVLLLRILTQSRPAAPPQVAQASSLPPAPKDPPPPQSPPEPAHTQPADAPQNPPPMQAPPTQPPKKDAPPDPPSMPPPTPPPTPPSPPPPSPPPTVPPKDTEKHDDAPKGAVPGAGGPRVTYAGTLAQDMKLTDVYMQAGLDDLPAGKAPPTTFPSGTKEMELVLRFSQTPPDGTTFGRQIRTEAGSVDLKGFVFLTEQNNSTGELTAMLGCEPESGAFADGDYQTTVKLNGETIALLNWTVGSSKAPK
ncbi:MAG TPA: hypothetical protein VMS17_14455 [Gemmataceae bacterium]|nr:hypothetical protein [Gemmataceae bacterium]